MRPLDQPHHSAWETALVFAVFFLQGAWPVPAQNEAHYLGKAIHYWHPLWIPDDFFLDSADTHKVFYFTVGWMALVLPPFALTWAGRFIVWLMLARAWRRLSYALLPGPWLSVITAAVFVMLQERFQLAGEWVIGGVEAKGFAYALVFVGLARLIYGRWNGVWLCFGAAAAFHVLVGGWAVVAAAVAWILEGKSRPSLKSMLPGLAAGFALSLLGLLPSLAMTRGAPADIVRQANFIYVFERLWHHLVFAWFPLVAKVRFALLVAVWIAVTWLRPVDTRGRRLRGFVAGCLLLAAAGALIDRLTLHQTDLRATLLKFYWFRLADVAVALALALELPRMAMGWWLQGKSERPPNAPRGLAAGAAWSVALLAAALAIRALLVRLAGGNWPLEIALAGVLLAVIGIIRLRGPARPYRALALTAAAWMILIAPAWHLANYASVRARRQLPPADVQNIFYYSAWRRACQWIADHPETVPREARFFTPLYSSTFRWYAGRSEVANWKDIPQDARSVVAWWERLHDLFDARTTPAGARWYPSSLPVFVDRGPAEVERLRAKYGADYLLTVRWPPRDYEVLYENEIYAVYRLQPSPKQPAVP